MSRRLPDAHVFRFFNEVGIIEQLSRNRVERRLPYGLKMSQFALLNHFVRVSEESSPARLAKAFQVSKGAMTNTIQRLQALDFVDVAPDPDDGRGKRVRITDAGRVAHAQSIAAFEPDMTALGSAFNPGAFEAALPFLEQVRSYLDEDRD